MNKRALSKALRASDCICSLSLSSRVASCSSASIHFFCTGRISLIITRVAPSASLAIHSADALAMAGMAAASYSLIEASRVFSSAVDSTANFSSSFFCVS
ncbi:hypothetical protein JAB2_49870 [Janthinobacterium sp. HH100]|nr:hypothetical protein JAB2_49870 [Janthinobacterium sp. HH100]